MKASRLQSASWVGVALIAVCWGWPEVIVAKTTPPICHSATRYQLVELPFLPKLITPAGVVAGTNEAHGAVLWRPDSGLEPLAAPEGFHYTEPVGFTATGDLIVNASDIQGKKRRAFVYSKHSMRALTGNQTWAHGIAAGIVVGEWVPEGRVRTEPVYWDQDKRPHSIPLCCGGVITAANQTREMIGNAYDEQGRYHAFVWNASQGLRTLGPPERFSSALAINDAGHILFSVDKQTYLVRSGSSQALKLSSQLDHSVQALNNCDFVVGGYGPFSDAYRAFLWAEKDGFQDLNSQVPEDLGWELQIASAINDRGEIVGQGELDGDDRGFLLRPQR